MRLMSLQVGDFVGGSRSHSLSFNVGVVVCLFILLMPWIDLFLLLERRFILLAPVPTRQYLLWLSGVSVCVV